MSRRNLIPALGSLILFSGTSSSRPAAVPISPSAPHYDLNVSFELPRGKLIVEGILTLPPKREAASSWQFELAERMKARAPLNIRCGKNALAVADLSSPSKNEYDDRLWRVTARQPCSAGNPVQLIFSYETTETASPQLNLEKDRGYAGSAGELWYPRLSRTTLHTARTTLNLPAGATGIATGKLVKRDITPRRSRLVFETTSPAKVAFAFGPYQDVGFKDPFPLTVLTLQPPDTARRIAEGFATGIKPLLAAFGPFPKPDLTIVEVAFKGPLLGIGEFGMTFADTSKFQGDFDFPYWTHEFAHEWWGNSVRPERDSPGATLLTEGLAQYSALVALETVKGPEAAAAYRKTARRHSLQAYSKLIEEGKDRPLVGPSPVGQDEILLGHNLATAKGAVLLDQLSRMIGRDRFHAILRSFLEANAGKTTTWAALETHINAQTNNAFVWWFEQWMHRPGAPDLTITPKVEGASVTIDVQQKGEIYRISLPIEVSGRWGRHRFEILMNSARAQRHLTAEGPVERVVIDPDGLLPRRHFDTTQ